MGEENGSRLQQHAPDAPYRNDKVADLFRAEAAPAPFARTPRPVQGREAVSAYAALRYSWWVQVWAKARRRSESSVVDEMATMVDSKGRLWLATRLHEVNLDDRLERPDYDAVISSGPSSEPEGSQYGKSPANI